MFVGRPIDGSVGHENCHSAFGQVHFEAAAVRNSGRETIDDSCQVIRNQVTAVLHGPDSHEFMVSGVDIKPLDQRSNLRSTCGLSDVEPGAGRHLSQKRTSHLNSRSDE